MAAEKRAGVCSGLARVALLAASACSVPGPLSLAPIWPGGQGPAARPVSPTPPPEPIDPVAVEPSAGEAPSSAVASPPPGRRVDAHADHVVLFPTAETHPQGTVFVGTYDLVSLQIGYAATDDFQLSTLVLLPLGDAPRGALTTGKLNLLRAPGGNVALIGGLDFVAVDGDDDAGGLARIGLVGQVCDSGCMSSISVSALAWVPLADRSSQVAALVSLGVTLRVSDVIALLIEPAALAVPAKEDVGAWLSYGVRLSDQRWGLDVTLVRPFFLDDDGGPLGAGVPLVVGTYRWP